MPGEKNILELVQMTEPISQSDPDGDSTTEADRAPEQTWNTLYGEIERATSLQQTVDILNRYATSHPDLTIPNRNTTLREIINEIARITTDPMGADRELNKLNEQGNSPLSNLPLSISRRLVGFALKDYYNARHDQEVSRLKENIEQFRADLLEGVKTATSLRQLSYRLYYFASQHPAVFFPGSKMQLESVTGYVGRWVNSIVEEKYSIDAAIRNVTIDLRDIPEPVRIKAIELLKAYKNEKVLDGQSPNLVRTMRRLLGGRR